MRGHGGGRIIDYTERNCRDYTKQKDTEGRISTTIQRRRAEAIQNKRTQRRENRL